MDTTSPSLEQDPLTKLFPAGTLIMSVRRDIFLEQNKSDTLARLIITSPFAAVTPSYPCLPGHFLTVFVLFLVLVSLLKELILNVSVFL